MRESDTRTDPDGFDGRDHGDNATPAPYEVNVGQAVCRELLLRTGRPMFNSVAVTERIVIALPRLTVKKAAAAGFDIDSGRELPREEVEQAIERLRREDPLGPHNLRLVKRVPVGGGPATLEFLAFDSPEPVRVASVPDAISQIRKTLWGWYVRLS